MDPRKTTPLLASLASFVVGALAGFGGAELLSRSSAADAQEGGNPLARSNPSRRDVGAEEDLTAAIRELRGTLDSLQGFLQLSASTPQPVVESKRAPAGETQSMEEIRDLGASIDAFAAALRGFEARSAAVKKTGGLVVPGWVDRAAAFGTDDLKRLHRAHRGEDGTDMATQEWCSRHLFLTMQEILDRYGRPNSIYRDDGFLVWCYLREVPGEVEDVDIYFHEGMVANVEYSYDWDD